MALVNLVVLFMMVVVVMVVVIVALVLLALVIALLRLVSVGLLTMITIMVDAAGGRVRAVVDTRLRRLGARRVKVDDVLLAHYIPQRDHPHERAILRDGHKLQAA